MKDQIEVPISAPAHWTTKPLGEVANVVNGGTPKSKVAAYWGNDVQWLTPKDMGKLDGREIAATPRTISETGLAKSSARLVPPQSVILSTRAPIGHLAINSVPMAFNQGCRGIIPGASLDHVFLYHFLAANRQRLDDLGSGTTFKELSGTSLKGLKIPLPPLEEQKRIVAVLDQAFAALDRARAHAEANLADAGELFAAARDERFEVLDACTRPLIDLCGDRGVSYGVIKLGDHVEDGVPCLRTSNVKPLRIDVAGMKRITSTLSADYLRTVLKGGEILVNVRGTLGGVAVAPQWMADWNLSREVAMVDVQRANPFFVAYFISSNSAQNWLTGVTKGAAYKGINLSDLRQLVIPIPNPDEQVRIVRELDEVNSHVSKLKEEYEQKLIEVSGLRQSLLQKAFSGRLTA